jgi:predicted AAA+ superfamily ATPase
LNYDSHFWRTKSGQEVDFILARGEVAVEVKGASRVASPELRSIKAFSGEYKPRTSIVVCQERRKRLHERILILPWRQFLDDLWAGKIIK